MPSKRKWAGGRSGATTAAGWTFWAPSHADLPAGLPGGGTRSLCGCQPKAVLIPFDTFGAHTTIVGVSLVACRT